MPHQQANQQHAIDGVLQFSPGDGGLPYVRIRNAAAEATISLFLADVEAAHVRQGGSEYELARTVYEAVQLIEGLGARLDPDRAGLDGPAVDGQQASAVDLHLSADGEASAVEDLEFGQAAGSDHFHLRS